VRDEPVDGEPLELRVVRSFDDGIPDEFWEGCPVHKGFKISGLKADLEAAARSEEAPELLQLLEGYCGDVRVYCSGRVTVAHLAALAGDPALACAVTRRAQNLGAHWHRWQDRDGRTPLHYAMFFDSNELARAFDGLCDVHAKDKWGKTALDVAADLGHHISAAAISDVQPLRALCSQSLQRSLWAAVHPALLDGLGQIEAERVARLAPLHEYPVLQRLADAAPSAVDPSRLRRSMSCIECWYADALGRKLAGALPPCLELIRVWDQLQAFQPLEATADGSAGGLCVLAQVPGQGQRKPPTIADRETFLERFRRRTGYTLTNIDWNNLLVIGGMVLACLTADDDEYARNFRDTDVDFYVVGLSGQAYRDRVARLVEQLPKVAEEEERNVYLRRELDECGGKVGLVVQPDRKRMRLRVVGVHPEGAVALWNAQNPRQEVVPGDWLVRVGDADCGCETMMRELREVKQEMCRWEKKMRHRLLSLEVRPASMDDRVPTATVLRTAQTITCCVRDAFGKPLPNIQVVLAPHASPAHLLFTTDLDCTAMGFDGRDLLATPRAREALRHRFNVARPEKYTVRGEWRTEARLLKYARRGFRVVDLGLKPGTKARRNQGLYEAAQRADAIVEAAAAGREAGDKRGEQNSALEAAIAAVRDTGVHGAELLLHAQRLRGLRWLLLHEAPLIRPGMRREDLLQLVRSTLRRSGSERGEQEEVGNAGRSDNGSSSGSEDLDRHRPSMNPEGFLEYDDGYGRAQGRLAIINPSRRKGNRVQHSGLRGREMSIMQAITEMDLESDRFQVRGWYDGVDSRDLLHEHAHLDPAEWKGIGDYRPMA